ncbi:MAG: NUDIX hydrolase [Bifidobacteriaceae bacterium]|nr:NUDIX hydrolase [Bifidobacteriaceae bacterium]
MACSDEVGAGPTDAWFECACGGRHWGLAGAAGLLIGRGREVLLQLRGARSHHGGSWGLPGGARRRGETPLGTALREAREEAGVDAAGLAPRWWSIADHGGWAYTTIAAEAGPDLDVSAGPANWETEALEWVDRDQVADRNLHPGLAAAWPVLESNLGRRLAVIVDAANVVGTRPDGWWKDRAGAAARLRDQLERLAGEGLANIWSDSPNGWYPEVTMVVEDRARGIGQGRGVRVVAAPGEGDDEIAAQARLAARAGRGPVLVATADKGLIARLPTGGPGVCAVLPPARLLSLIA